MTEKARIQQIKYSNKPSNNNFPYVSVKTSGLASVKSLFSIEYLQRAPSKTTLTTMFGALTWSSPVRPNVTLLQMGCLLLPQPLELFILASASLGLKVEVGPGPNIR